MQSGLAPIVLFVYNRPDHTLQTLKALQKNYLADKSTLFIYSDGPKNNALDIDIENISKVRKIIKDQKWCRDVIIIESKINKGLANSVIEGVSEIVNKFGKVIVLEDDLITSKEFLKYVNNALEIYSNEEKVYGIAGYTIQNNLIGKETFFLPISSSWGWATWKRAWKDFETNGLKLLNAIEKHKNEFDFGGYEYFKMLEDQVNNKNSSWAIRFYASVFLKKGLFLFPDYTFIKNIGFDNSGTHCNDVEFDQNILFDKPLIVNYIKPVLDENIVNKYKNQFGKHSEKKPGIIDLIIRKLRFLKL